MAGALRGLARQAARAMQAPAPAGAPRTAQHARCTAIRVPGVAAECSCTGCARAAQHCPVALCCVSADGCRKGVRSTWRAGVRAGAQQRQALGDLPYKPNKYIEDWGTAREHIELTYRWDGKTLRTVALWMVAFPWFLYNVTAFEFQKSDRKYGREERKFAGHDHWAPCCVTSMARLGVWLTSLGSLLVVARRCCRRVCASQ